MNYSTIAEEVAAIQASLLKWVINLDYPIGHEQRIIAL